MLYAAEHGNMMEGKPGVVHEIIIGLSAQMANRKIMGCHTGITHRTTMGSYAGLADGTSIE